MHGPTPRRGSSAGLLVLALASLASPARAADPAPPAPDVRIDEVTAPAVVNLTDVLGFDITVTNNRGADVPCEVLILMRRPSFRGFRQVARRKAVLRPGRTGLAVRLMPFAVGLQIFRVALSPFPGKVDAHYDLAVNVVDMPTRALVIAGAPSREYVLLAPVLIRDPGVKTACWFQSADPDYIQQGNVTLDRLPTTAREWAAFDVVILLDPDPDRLTKDQVAGLESLVRSGGGLMIVGGRTFGPAALVRKRPAVRALLPVTLDPKREPDRGRIEKPFRVARTLVARRHPLFAIHPNTIAMDRLWSAAERNPFYVAQPVAGVKSGGIALLQRAGDDRETACLMAAARHGEGVVIYSGLDSLWRWREVADGSLYERFWHHVVRYLSPPGPAEAPSAVLTADRKQYEAGDTVDLTLRILRPGLVGCLKGGPLEITATDEAGNAAAYRLHPDPKGGPVYRGTGKALRPGLLVFQARLTGPKANAVLFEVPLGVPVWPARTRVRLTAPGMNLAEARLRPIEIACRIESATDVRTVRVLHQVGGGPVRPLSEAVTGLLPQTGRDIRIRFTWPLDRMDVPVGTTIRYLVRVDADRPEGPVPVESESAYIRLVTPTECQKSILEQTVPALAETRLAFQRQWSAFQDGRRRAADGGAGARPTWWAALALDQDRAMANAKQARETVRASITRAERNGLTRACMAVQLKAAAGLLDRVIERAHPAIRRTMDAASLSDTSDAVRVNALRIRALTKVREDQETAALALHRARRRLENWADLQTAAVKATLLHEEQRAVAAETRRIAARYIGREPEDLTDAELEALILLGRRQKKIFEDARALERDLIKRMRITQMTRRGVAAVLLARTFSALRGDRVADRTQRAWLQIENAQPSMITADQDAVVKTLETVRDDLLTAGQTIAEDPPVMPDMPLPSPIDSEAATSRPSSGDPETPRPPPKVEAPATDQPVEDGPYTMPPLIFPPPPPPPPAEGDLVLSIATALDLVNDVFARMRYLAENPDKSPRFQRTKLGMLRERQGDALAALDKAIAAAGRHKRPFCRDALAWIRADAVQTQSLIRAGHIWPLTQQLQHDLVNGLRDVLSFLAWREAAAESAKARRAEGDVDVFGRRHLLMSRDAGTVEAMIATINRAWVLQRRAAATVRRFETRPAGLDAERAIEKRNRKRAAEDQKQVAALLRSADARRDDLTKQGRYELEGAGIPGMVALEADGYIAGIAGGTPDKELGGHLGKLADALAVARRQLAELVDARLPAPAYTRRLDTGLSLPSSDRTVTDIIRVGKAPAFIIDPYAGISTDPVEILFKPRNQTMVSRSLGYLIRKQDKDGGWFDAKYPSNTGVTGLCCLALMAAGNRPRAGPQGDALDRGLAFLIRNARPDGSIVGENHNPLGPMYEQCYATMALTQACGDLPWQPAVRGIIGRSVRLLERSQKRDGGWRYTFSTEGQSDTCVTANVFLALWTARKAGFTVKADTFRRAVAFMERCGLPEGGFRYRLRGRIMSPSMGGAGILVLAAASSLDHPMIPPTRDRIDYDYRRHTVNELVERRYAVFNTFCAGLTMYLCGPEYWPHWYRKTVMVYRSMQRRDGELRDGQGNTVYPTAQALMVLLAPLGYQPMFER